MKGGIPITKAQWAKKIKQACVECGVYRAPFDAPIKALSEILERRDEADKCFRESGEPLVVVFANGNTGTNSWVKLWVELNTQALRYWSELGLTPAGLKRIDENAMKIQKPNALAEALKDVGI